MSILVSNVNKVYGTQTVLDDVTISIEKGEIVGLLGPNGAGKSTLMKIITCFIPPTSGKVSVSGIDINENPLEVKKLVGYLPENNPLYYEMYVREYLSFVAGIYKIPGKEMMGRIDEIIEITGLAAEQHKKIGTLSKGFKQRVGIAQALIHNPDILILDEPTSGLDPNQLTEIRNLIRDIGKEKTVLFSTHIMQEVEAVCDRVIIINQGKIVADDKTGNITSIKSRNRIIVEFETTVKKELLEMIPGVCGAEKLNGNTWILSSENDIDIRPAINKFVAGNGLNIQSLRKEEHKLEEIFHQLTQ